MAEGEAIIQNERGGGRLGVARVAETRGGKDEKSLRMAIPEKTGCVTVESTPTQRHPPLPGHHTLEEKSQYFPALAQGRENIQRAKGSE